MLVLSRKKDETIVIGDDIVMTVMEVKAGKVRLGIQAPREVRIVRKEIVNHPGTSESNNHASSC